jgi:hypothetical protein
MLKILSIAPFRVTRLARHCYKVYRIEKIEKMQPFASSFKKSLEKGKEREKVGVIAKPRSLRVAAKFGNHSTTLF